MAIYRYIVTVETTPDAVVTSDDIANEIDANLEYEMGYGGNAFGVEHFTVDTLSTIHEPLRVSQFDAFECAPLSPDGRYQS